MKKFLIKKSSGLYMVFSVLALMLGLGKAFIDAKFNILTVFLSLIGIYGLISLLLRRVNSSWHQKMGFPFNRFKTICLIAALVLILLDINIIAHRWNARFDVTKNKLHTLSKETLNLIGDLKKPVKLTALYVGFPPKYLEDLLKEYSAQSHQKISFEIIDPMNDIGYAAQFGNIISGKESKVVVQSGSERKDVDFSDAPLNEELLNNAIVSVSRQSRRVYFLKGHQEYSVLDEGNAGLSTFAEILKTNNFKIGELVLGLNGKVPDDCDLLVIPGPKDDLSQHEEEVITDYLNEGGDAFIMVENTVVTTPDKPLTKDQENKNPSLNNILRAWGIEVEPDIVVDLANHAGDDVGSPATKSYMAHKAIVSSLDYTFYVRPRSIMMLKSRRPTIKMAPLVLTASEDQSWGETNRMLKVKYDEGVDRPGPVPIAYVLSEPKIGNKKSITRLVVFTDADFLTNVYIGSYSNAEMGLNVAYWLTDLDYQPLLGKKNVDVSRLDLTSRQKRQVVVVLVFIPVIVLLAGIMVWINKSGKC